MDELYDQYEAGLITLDEADAKMKELSLDLVKPLTSDEAYARIEHFIHNEADAPHEQWLRDYDQRRRR